MLQITVCAISLKILAWFAMPFLLILIDDGKTDLIVAGEWMPVTFLKNDQAETV